MIVVPFPARRLASAVMRDSSLALLQGSPPLFDPNTSSFLTCTSPVHTNKGQCLFFCLLFLLPPLLFTPKGRSLIRCAAR